ncbi:hypothetical protein ABT336_01630 [Micromonospora sp. NPDC000207]|uniref:hypothetical protein n=1 Tax=Micromonospora sp. NPDC000207 TaxID=3154246 RepID=UPI003319C783
MSEASQRGDVAQHQKEFEAGNAKTRQLWQQYQYELRAAVAMTSNGRLFLQEFDRRNGVDQGAGVAAAAGLTFGDPALHGGRGQRADHPGHPPARQWKPPAGGPDPSCRLM